MIDEPDNLDRPKLRLPERLVADLRAAERIPPANPQIDHAILSTARRALIRRRRTRHLLIPLTTGALAAAIGLIFTLRPFSSSSPAARADARDLNADGRIDILDAFTLARRLETAQSLPVWDFNHDGHIDRRDVDAIASNAVKLSNLHAGWPILCEAKGGFTMIERCKRRDGSPRAQTAENVRREALSHLHSVSDALRSSRPIIATPPIPIAAGWIAHPAGGAS